MIIAEDMAQDRHDMWTALQDGQHHSQWFCQATAARDDTAAMATWPHLITKTFASSACRCTHCLQGSRRTSHGTHRYASTLRDTGNVLCCVRHHVPSQFCVALCRCSRRFWHALLACLATCRRLWVCAVSCVVGMVSMS